MNRATPKTVSVDFRMDDSSFAEIISRMNSNICSVQVFVEVQF